MKICYQEINFRQHSLELREAALREALEKALSQWAMYADSGRDSDGGYLDESQDPEDMEAMIYRQCKQALSSPAQPSRYQLMEAVVEAAHDVVADHEDDLSNHPQVVALAKALTAYDKAGEGAGE